jgi:hypothetical protein
LSFALDDEYSRESLRGLRGVHVIVEVLRPAVKKGGLTEAMIRTDTELKLRLAGIRVLTQDEALKEAPSVLSLSKMSGSFEILPSLFRRIPGAFLQ